MCIILVLFLILRVGGQYRQFHEVKNLIQTLLVIFAFVSRSILLASSGSQGWPARYDAAHHVRRTAWHGQDDGELGGLSLELLWPHAPSRLCLGLPLWLWGEGHLAPCIR